MFIDFHSHMSVGEHPGLKVYDPTSNYKDDGTSYYCMGVHPWNVEKYHGNLASLIQGNRDDRLVALGECGLDRIHRETWDRQVELFKDHLNYARDMKISVLVLHCVKAWQDIVKLIDESGYEGRLLFHDYNGDEQITRTLLKKNVMFSYGDKLFRPESRGYQNLKLIPMERLLLETDDGKRGTIVDIYQKAAEVLKISVAELENQMEQNWRFLFPDHPIKYRGRTHA